MSSARTLLAAWSGSPSLKMVGGLATSHQCACTSVQIGIARDVFAIPCDGALGWLCQVADGDNIDLDRSEPTLVTALV